MGFMEFMGTALKANKAIDHAATQRIIESVGAGVKDLKKGAKLDDLGGKLGAIKEYNESLRTLDTLDRSGKVTAEQLKVAASDSINAADNLMNRAGGKTTTEAINRSVSKDNATALNEAINGGKYNSVDNFVDKQAQKYIDAYSQNPETIKDSFARLKDVNAAGSKGTTTSFLDATKSYLTSADIMGNEALSNGMKAGLIATRASAVVGGAALAIGGTRAVGRAIFGGDSSNSGGYSY